MKIISAELLADQRNNLSPHHTRLFSQKPWNVVRRGIQSSYEEIFFECCLHGSYYSRCLRYSSEPKIQISLPSQSLQSGREKQTNKHYSYMGDIKNYKVKYCQEYRGRIGVLLFLYKVVIEGLLR